MCRWCEWVAAAALHAVTTRSIGAGCLSTGGKRLSSACRRRESEVHAGYALVALPCSTSTTRTCVSMSAGPLPKFCLREVLVNGEDTDTTPSHAYLRIPTSVPHHTLDYLHYTTPHYTTPLPYHNKHPATATNTATTTTTITAIINQAADRCLPSAP